MLPLTWYYSEGVVNFSGLVVCAMLIKLYDSLYPVVRRYSYKRLFELNHVICATLFVLTSNLHDYNTIVFAWPGILCRLVSNVLYNTTMLYNMYSFAHYVIILLYPITFYKQQTFQVDRLLRSFFFRHHIVLLKERKRATRVGVELLPASAEQQQQMTMVTATARGNNAVNLKRD